MAVAVAVLAAMVEAEAVAAMVGAAAVAAAAEAAEAAEAARRRVVGNGLVPAVAPAVGGTDRVSRTAHEMVPQARGQRQRPPRS